MDEIGESMKKLILAGIGAAAATGEKSQELLDELARKGEAALNRGPVRNEELKHDAANRARDRAEEVIALLPLLTAVEREQIQRALNDMAAEDAKKEAGGHGAE